MSLYDAVAPDLRPAVLQLAMAAAARRWKKDVPARFTDSINRTELAAWYDSTEMPEAAAMIRVHPAIRDGDTFTRHWPTSAQVSRWRDDLITRLFSEGGGAPRPRDHGAAGYLTERTITGTSKIKVAAYRDGLHRAIGAIAAELPAGTPLPGSGDLWDLRALYLEPLWAYARPTVRQMAEAACELAGWDPATPAPPDSHPLLEIGPAACSRAAYIALAPLEHAALVREMRAFRLVAYGLASGG